jgi:hypothetical protein
MMSYMVVSLEEQIVGFLHDIFQKKKLSLVDSLVKTAGGAAYVSQLSVSAYEKIEQLCRDGEQGLYLIINGH